MKTIHLIAAARPNFMKVAPLYHALKATTWAIPQIVHTGQHYDYNMSASFFEDLGLPSPDFHLEVGSGSHAEQTGNVMMAYEKTLIANRPDLVVVVGDVNSTMACTLAAVKLGIKVAHLEAGLRSYDRRMPEELNRIVTDSLADFLWTPSIDGDENLVKEGVPKSKIEMVGNIMLDSFEMLRSKIMESDIVSQLGLTKGKYGIVTLHRPSNVDVKEELSKLVDLLVEVSVQDKILFAIHPRTKKRLEEFSFADKIFGNKNIVVTEPQPYIKFMSLLLNSKYALTDSGGIQEETTYMGIPCFTLRENTERPVTITQGTNKMTDAMSAAGLIKNLGSTPNKTKPLPSLWDGKTAGRVVSAIQRILS